MAIVSPNSLAEADFASLALDTDRTLYISPIQARKKRCKVWKQVQCRIGTMCAKLGCS